MEDTDVGTGVSLSPLSRCRAGPAQTQPTQPNTHTTPARLGSVTEYEKVLMYPSEKFSNAAFLSQ
jgi:hypothetical protein